jgi:predicted metal-dependent phosphotriesterase family hydrolase
MEEMERRHGPFWSYLNDDGELREEIRGNLREVLEAIAEADVIFDTGHAGPEECLVLVEEALEAGVEKVVVDHPLSITSQVPIEQQVEMAEMGAYIEQSWAKMQPTGGAVDPAKYAEAIEAVGPDRTVLVTDYAAGSHPPPEEAMREYVVTMKQYGITDDEIETMTKDNPRELLDL